MRSYINEPWIRGIIHDFSMPLAQRLERRVNGFTGPYYVNPEGCTPGTGRGFYSATGDEITMDRRGSMLRLRLAYANDFLRGSRLSHVRAYGCDDFGDGEMIPIIARLPKSRGFLAGWTMGAGMCGSLDATIYATAEDAARAAHSTAEHDAQREADYQREEREREAEEEARQSALGILEDAEAELAAADKHARAVLAATKREG